MAGLNSVLTEVVCAVALRARTPWCQGLSMHTEQGRWSTSLSNRGFNRQKDQATIKTILTPLRPVDAPLSPVHIPLFLDDAPSLYMSSGCKDFCSISRDCLYTRAYIAEV